MKAVRMHGYGGVEQLFYKDADEPRLTQPNEVLVKLKAASLNHIDIWNRLGATGIVVQMPHIPLVRGGRLVTCGATPGGRPNGDLTGIFVNT